MPPTERRIPEPADALSQSDLALVRVLEDLIDILIPRGLIQFTDLPLAAQAKLLSRRETRAALSDPPSFCLSRIAIWR